MSEPAENIPERVTRLEQRTADVHDLARKTDEEVASWRGVLTNHTKVLNGMSDRIELLDSKVDQRFDKVEAEMREGFHKLGLGQAHITALLHLVIKKTDETDGPSDGADG